MGNYTKSFNFRNGVQVDDSNFIVNANGLVGIGTTIPEKHLDVRGNAKVIGDARISGLTSLTDVNVVGVLTVGSLKLDSSNGIINATKFIGDASGLTNIVAIATDGFIANVGSLSTTAKIGIGNLSPTSQLDVTGNSKFVGVTTFAGITTVTGETLFTKQLNVSGVSTFAGITTVVGDTLFAKDASISGVISATTFKGAVEASTLSSSDNVDLNANLDVDGTTDLDLLNVAEKAIFKDDVDFIGDPVGTALTSIQFHKGDGTNSDLDALRFYDSAAIDLGVGNTGNMRLRGNFNNSSFILGFGNNLFIDGSDFGNTTIKIRTRDARNGIVVNPDTTSGTVELYHSSGGTSTKRLETSGVGVTVFNQLDVASLNGGTSGLSSHFGSLRYGNENDGESPYSTRRSLDLINTDSGNINYYLNANNLSVPVSGGDFHWHKGFDNVTLMTLTNTGALGIGKTIPDPTKKLHVSGGSKITGISTFGSDLFVGNNLNVKNNLTVSTVNANVTGNLTGNVTATSGTSTFSGVKINDKSETNFAGVGIGTTVANSNYIETINSTLDKTSQFIVNTEGKVAIGTDAIRDGVGLNAHKEKATFGAVGVGTTTPLAAIDFSEAGQDGEGVFANRMFMLPPKINTSQRDNLVGVTNGAIVFNTDGNQLQVYIDGWVGIGTTNKVDS